MKITLVRANDWEGLYVDGKLYSEDHSIDPEIIMDLLKGEVVWLTKTQDKHLCEVGRLPENLDDLKNWSTAS